MKTRTSVLVLMMTVCPLVGRAQVCTDFDDDMNIIEYDCSRSLADVKREISEAKAKAEAEAAAAKARAEAEEAARIAAEKAAKEKAAAEERAAREKAAAEERARQEAARIAAEKAKAEEKARKEAEKKAAAEKAKAEREARRLACAAPQTWLFGKCTNMSLKYFVAGGYTNVDIDTNFSPSGFNAEIGARLDPLQNNWYYTFSIMGQRTDGDATFHIPTEYGMSKLPPYDVSLESLYLTAGVGYKFWRVFDVYGKIAPGFASMKFKGGPDNMNIGKATFDVAGIVGLNARLYKWLHIYGEAQLSMNHPVPGAEKMQDMSVLGGGYYMPLPEQKIDTDAVLMMRGGVKLVF